MHVMSCKAMVTDQQVLLAGLHLIRDQPGYADGHQVHYVMLEEVRSAEQGRVQAGCGHHHQHLLQAAQDGHGQLEGWTRKTVRHTRQ